MFCNLRRIEKITSVALRAGFYLASVIGVNFWRGAIPVAGITGKIQVICIVQSAMNTAI